MEQFERYSEAVRSNEIDCSDYDIRCTGLSCKDCQTIRKAAWKTALKCVRDEILPNCHEPMDIYDFIEEELNNDWKMRNGEVI